MKTASAFPALFTPVHNRGSAPAEFLNVLVDTIRDLPDEVFSREYGTTEEVELFEGYMNIGSSLPGPLTAPDGLGNPILGFDIRVRRAIMCEVLRVLGGFESSWNWTEGRDVTNPSSNTPVTEEAGIFQCSANSMNFHLSLRDMVRRDPIGKFDRFTSTTTAEQLAGRFIALSKAYPKFAIEYCARLLRFTVRHHGPLVRREIVPWLRTECIQAFQNLLTQTDTTMPPTTPTENPAKRIPYVIDPGHGGADSGAVGYLGGTAYFEKDVVLRVAQALANQLTKDGRFNVALTRLADSFPSLTQRATLANQAGAKLVSIHANSGGGTGFECFTTPGQTDSDILATSLLDAYKEHIPLPGRYDTKDGDPDKESRFTVLTATKGPAVLFELGFMDRESDLQLMLEPAFPMKAANALYLGILDYEGLAVPSTRPTPDPVEETTDTPPVESLAGAFLEGYEAAIQQLVIREDAMTNKVKKSLSGESADDFASVSLAKIVAKDARSYLSHPDIRKAAGLPG